MEHIVSECLTLRQPHMNFLKTELFSVLFFKKSFYAIFIVKMVSVIFSHYPNNTQPPTIQKYEWKPVEICGHNISCLGDLAPDIACEFPF